MKKAADPRHKKREKAIQDLFRLSFHRQPIKSKLANSVWQKKKEINKIIAQSAPQFPLEQINKIDLAILRLAVWELLLGKTAPYKVVIDEAVELAKKYGSEKSPQFVNGVLGTVVKKCLKLQK